MVSRQWLARALLALLSAASCLVYRPAAADESGFYVGADGGYTLQTDRRRDLDYEFVGAYRSADYDIAVGPTSYQRSGIVAADVGYLFAPYFAVEAAYLDLGTLRYSMRGTDYGYLGRYPVADVLHISSRGPALDAVGRLPLTDAVSLELRLGAYEGKTMSHFWGALAGSYDTNSLSQSSTSVFAAAGASYLLDAHWMVRLDYLYLDRLDEKFFATKFDVGAVTAGFSYFF
jgi:opacity protein-like surface antigen